MNVSAADRLRDWVTHGGTNIYRIGAAEVTKQELIVAVVVVGDGLLVVANGEVPAHFLMSEVDIMYVCVCEKLEIR